MNGIDPRGARFAAALTSAVLALAVVTGSVWPLALQAVAFGVGTVAGVPASPYGVLFRRLVRPHLEPPVELEDPAPPRFSQTVGLAVTGVGLLAWAFGGGSTAVQLSAGLAFVAAFLNAAFGLCLGCELYLLLHRARARAHPSP